MGKRITFIMLIFTLLIYSVARADGPPIDSCGYPTTECYFIGVTKKQIQEMGVNRVLTLTSKQKAILTNPYFPKKIDVVTKSYNGCTCAMLYCIWFKHDTIAIPKYYVDRDKIDTSFYKNYEPFINDSSINLSVHGKPYLRGKLISHDELLRLIDVISKRERNIYKSIRISLAPLCDNKSEKRARSLLEKITDYCKKKKVKLFFV